MIEDHLHISVMVWGTLSASFEDILIALWCTKRIHKNKWSWLWLKASRCGFNGQRKSRRECLYTFYLIMAHQWSMEEKRSFDVRSSYNCIFCQLMLGCYQSKAFHNQFSSKKLSQGECKLQFLHGFKSISRLAWDSHLIFFFSFSLTSMLIIVKIVIFKRRAIWRHLNYL